MTPTVVAVLVVITPQLRTGTPPRVHSGGDLTRNVHTESPFRFLKRWQNERCVSLRPQIFTTESIRAEKCRKRLPRFLGARTCCFSAAISPSTDCPKKRRNSPPIFAVR